MIGLTVALLLIASATLLALPSGRHRSSRGTARTLAGARGIDDPALVLDLLGALLTAGASVEQALSTVSGSCGPVLAHRLAQVRAARMLGASWDAAWSVGVGSRVHPADGADNRSDDAGAAMAFAEVREGLRFATSTGAPSAALLHAHAGQLRRRHNREIDRRAAALGVQLVLPLGLCSLPAFICLGVVPVVLGLIPDLGLP